jgi:hypothetical protein
MLAVGIRVGNLSVAVVMVGLTANAPGSLNLSNSTNSFHDCKGDRNPVGRTFAPPDLTIGKCQEGQSIVRYTFYKEPGGENLLIYLK